LRKLSKVLLGVIVAALIVGSAVASYTMTSNTVTVTVNDPVVMTLTASTSSTVSGQSITLTAYIADQVNGVTVTFYDNGVSCGQAVSSGGGYAKLTIEPSMGTHNYYAVGLHP
jgi:hypothetical protein